MCLCNEENLSVCRIIITALFDAMHLDLIRDPAQTDMIEHGRLTPASTPIMTSKRKPAQEEPGDDLDHRLAQLMHSQIPTQLSNACAQLVVFGARITLKKKETVQRLVSLLEHDDQFVALEAASTILTLMGKGGEWAVRIFYANCITPIILQKFIILSSKAADLAFQIIECIVGTIDAAIKQINQSNILEIMQGVGLTEAVLSLLLTMTEDNPDFSSSLVNSPLYQQLEQSITPYSLAILCNIELNDHLIVKVFTSLTRALKDEDEQSLDILFPTAINILEGVGEKPIRAILPELLPLLQSYKGGSELFDFLTNLVLEFPEECVTESFFDFYTGLVKEHVEDPSFCRLLVALCRVTARFAPLDQARQRTTNPECLDILKDIDETE